MTQTTNYELNIVEGSDVVNPLVQTNPNFNRIDEVMKANEVRGIATATEVKSGTNHAITRSVANAVFRFVATSDFRTGDTFSVDGDTVTATLASGELPKDRAFVVGASVSCILDGIRLTLMNCEAPITGINADDVAFDNTGTDLTADDVEEAIKQINAKTVKQSVTVTGDDIKTFRELFNLLFSNIDITKINEHTKLKIGLNIYTILGYTDSELYFFMSTGVDSQYMRNMFVVLKAINSTNQYYEFSTNPAQPMSFNDASSRVPASGFTISLIY